MFGGKKSHHNRRLMVVRVDGQLITTQRSRRATLNSLPDMRNEMPSHLLHIGVIAFEPFLQHPFFPHRPSRKHTADKQPQEYSDPRPQQQCRSQKEEKRTGIQRVADVAIRPRRYHRLPSVFLDAYYPRQVRVLPIGELREVRERQEDNDSYEVEPRRHARPMKPDGVEWHRNHPDTNEDG